MVLMQKNDATASFNYIAIKEGNDYSKDFSHRGYYNLFRLALLIINEI